MQFFVAAALFTLNIWIKPTQPLTPVPIPAGMILPNMGPIEDEQKPKRIRKKKGEPAEPKLRSQKNKNEREIRACLERITGLKWPSCRPSFLRGIHGRNLEIDMYCRELNVCVEHQGQQHLNYVRFFHKNGYSDFEEQKSRDHLKAALLRQAGVKLVTISHVDWDHIIDPKAKDDFLLLKLGSAE